MPRRRPTAAALALCTGAALALPAVVGSSAASAAPPVAAPGKTCPKPAALSFAEPTYVDTDRAGGEPLVATLPDGRLLYSAHAGTTHFFTPEAANPGTSAFVENYEGQTYIWTSDDNGKTWEFRPRLVAPDGVPASGFSDPEVAIDSDGNVYFSEINLANVAVSSSQDNGSTYNLENFFGAVMTDRQWMEADRPGELYFVANAFGGGTGTPPNPSLGHFISKSTDGGKTFTQNIPNPGTGAFVENYTNQTYVWTSDDNGKTWQFRPRFLPPDNAPFTGFSDPEVAIDSAGNVYFSEINLANVAVSKSEDNSETYKLQNFFGAILTDRQWMEADRENELYFVANAFGGGTGTPPGTGTGHYIAKSTDGGKTFTKNVPDVEGGDGIGDIRVDKRTGTVYETHHPSYGGGPGVLSMAAFRNAREGDLKPETHQIAEGVSSVSHWPAFDLDPEGNLYIVWDEDGRGDREAGIYFASSKDGARTWSAPVRVDKNANTDIWPWLAVGDKGRVALSWLEADVSLPNHDAETPGDHGWRIMGAATTTGLGCAGGKAPTFSVATATKEPVHTGTICQGGTTCQAQLIDRRLGDYFSMEVDGTGAMYMGYSDTRTPAAVSLPGFVRQSGGPSLLAPKSAPGKAPTATTGQPARPVQPARAAGGALPATGATALLPWSGAFLLLGLGLALRRRRAA